MFFTLQHLFALEAQTELVRCIQDAAANHVGISIKVAKESIAFDTFQTRKFGKYRYVSSTCNAVLLLALSACLYELVCDLLDAFAMV